MRKKVRIFSSIIVASIILGIGLIAIALLLIHKGEKLGFYLLVIGVSMFEVCVVVNRLDEQNTKKMQKKEIETISHDEFEPISFREINDPIIDEILKHVKAYVKKSKDDDKVIVKIVYSSNEIITEVPVLKD